MIRLNPQGRRQNKKHRPTIPVAECLWPLLEEWSTSERFTGFTRTNYPSKQWRLASTRAGLPEECTPRSLRHLVATELRHAHMRYGAPRVPLDVREMFMGHRRARTNDLYGGYEADYLNTAKTASLPPPSLRQTTPPKRVRRRDLSF
jgi:integrase